MPPKRQNASARVRTHVEEHEPLTAFQELHRASFRAKALFDLTPVPIEVPKKIAKTKRRPQFGKNKKPKSRVTTLALVSLPMSVTPTSDAPLKPDKSGTEPTPLPAKLISHTLSLNRFDHFDIWLKPEEISVDQLRTWTDVLRKEYGKASKKAEFICANELGFPSFWPGRPPRASRKAKESDRLFAAARRDAGRLRQDFESFLQTTARELGRVIMPGSYHDPVTFENTAPTFFPDDGHSRYHSKFTSAYPEGESIKVSTSRNISVFNYDGTTFCVLICSDAFDLNIFHRLAVNRGKSLPEQDVQVIFVPSYYEATVDNNAMLIACKQLSRITGTIVVFVSQYVGGGIPCKAVFMCGDRVFKSADPFTSYFPIRWNTYFKKYNLWQKSPIARELAKIPVTEVRKANSFNPAP